MAPFFPLLYTMLTVSQLFIYPVKSLGGIEVAQAQVTSRGLQHDRRWMLVDEHHNFISQREEEALALFDVSIQEEGLKISYRPTGAALDVPFRPPNPQPLTVEVWSDVCRALTVSKEADGWFSSLLGKKCRLVYMPDDELRRVDNHYARNGEITSFADAFPLLLIGQASLDDLNSRLHEKITMLRFRPNVVFTGGLPYEEDMLQAFSINNIQFLGVKLCARCSITTINPQTAEKAKEPLRTLATYRMQNNKIYFGQNLLHRGKGTIHTGDNLEVTARHTSGLFALLHNRY